MLGYYCLFFILFFFSVPTFIRRSKFRYRFDHCFHAMHFFIKKYFISGKKLCSEILTLKFMVVKKNVKGEKSDTGKYRKIT